MPKAILKNGVIQPVEPLPADWRDGQVLQVEVPGEDQRELSPEEFDQVWRELEDLCAQADPAEDEKVMQTMAESKQRAKEWMRKHMGLPE